jgi:hypothetical protein
VLVQVGTVRKRPAGGDEGFAGAFRARTQADPGVLRLFGSPMLLEEPACQGGVPNE